MSFIYLIFIAFAAASVLGTKDNALNKTPLGLMKNMRKCASDGGLTGIVNCAGVHALSQMERVANQATIQLFPGITLNNNSTTPKAGKSITQSDDLPTNPDEKAAKLYDLMLNATGRLFAGKTVKIQLAEALGGSLEEGRGRNKNKGGMGALMLGFGTRMLATVPVIIGGIALLAGKALVVGKLALVISGILFFQQFLSTRRFIDPGYGFNNIGPSYGAGPSYGVPSYPSPAYGTNNIGGGYL